MVRVYVLNPPYLPHFGRSMRWQDTGRAGTLYYPIWLAYATGLLEMDYETRLVDAPAWGWNKEQVLQDVKKFQPDLVIAECSFPSLNNDIAVVEAIKETCAATTLLAGPPASQFAEKILQSKGVDVVARWEYDLTVKEVAEAVAGKRRFDDIKGISFKKGGAVAHNPDRPFTSNEDLDRIPFVSPVYKKHLRLQDYFLGNSLFPEVQIFTGRGCPFQCTFCSWPQTLTGREYRVRTIDSVIAELEWIQNNLPEVKEVFFEDDTFSINKKRVISFAEEYLRKGLRIVWSCNARADLDYETMRKMREANCRLLIVGYESGSDSILSNIKKGTTVGEIRQFARDARRAGLLVNGDFIIGLPGETKQTLELTRRLINEVRPDILQVSVASPFPGSEFYRWAEGNGFLLTRDCNDYLDERGHQRAILSYPELSSGEMVGTVDKILKSYYLSPSYVSIALRRLFRRNGFSELQVLWHSAKAFLTYLGNRAS